MVNLAVLNAAVTSLHQTFRIGSKYRLGNSREISWTSLKFVMEIGECLRQFALNADGISFSWKQIPSFTFIACEKTVSGFKAVMDHLTLFLSRNSTENLKLKLQLVHHTDNHTILTS